MAKGDAKNTGNMTCYHGVCSKCHGTKLLVVGLLVLANALLNFVEWEVLIGVLLALFGALQLWKPVCPHCS